VTEDQLTSAQKAFLALPKIDVWTTAQIADQISKVTKDSGDAREIERVLKGINSMPI
jgi:hypothetical protein